MAVFFELVLWVFGLISADRKSFLHFEVRFFFTFFKSTKLLAVCKIWLWFYEIGTFSNLYENIPSIVWHPIQFYHILYYIHIHIQLDHVYSRLLAPLIPAFLLNRVGTWTQYFMTHTDTYSRWFVFLIWWSSHLNVIFSSDNLTKFFK